MSDAQKNKSADDQEASPAVSGRLVKIERNEAGRLMAHVEGRREPIEDVRIARCFPWSLPGQYVSVRDKEGKEIALMKSLDELDGPSRKIAEQELCEKIFSPKIQRVLEYKHEFGVTSIKVQTDRGEVTFQIRSRDDVRILSETRALFRDVDGNTYELPDLTALDPASQKHFHDYF